MSVCLRLTGAAVQRALDNGGVLSRTDLMRVDDSQRDTFRSACDVVDGRADALQGNRDDLMDLCHTCLVRTQSPQLTLANYPPLAADTDILLRCLGAAIQKRRTGVNVLLHRRPRTGKTQYVRAIAIASEPGTALREVPVDDAARQPRCGEDRFVSYRLAQALLSGDTAVELLVFDEVEGVPLGYRASEDAPGVSADRKGWINQVLERNPVPTFWITNAIDGIDPAFRRRFNLVLKVDIPRASARRRLIDQHLMDLDAADDWRARVARHDALVPAVVARVAGLSAVICASKDAPSAEEVLSACFRAWISLAPSMWTTETLTGASPRFPPSWQCRDAQPTWAYRRRG